MTYCIDCGSDHVIKKGTVKSETSDIVKQRFYCKDCHTNFYHEITSEPEVENKQGDLFKMDEQTKHKVKSKDIFVVTCAQNDTPIEKGFFDSLLKYCEIRGAELMIIPTRYKNPSAIHSIKGYTWPSTITPYLTDDVLDLSEHIKVMGNVQVQATASNPLSGLQRLSKGKSIVIGHPQIEMTTLPVNKDHHPIVFTTTGTISKRNYSETKAGIKGEFSHNISAVVIEVDRQNDKFHIRHLVSGEDGSFYDLEWHYTPNGRNKLDRVLGIVLGDEHVLFMDGNVKKCTFTNENSLVNKLRPEKIVRHDVIDCFTVSHHHRRDKFLQYLKFTTSMNKLEDELKLTCDHMVSTTPLDTQTVMVSSNHHNHVAQFLNEANPDNEPWNAKLYHELKYRMLLHIEEKKEVGDPFRLWFEANYQSDKDRFIWTGDDESLYIGQWNVANHGHLGTNGSRGSRNNLSKVPEPMIIGHSHGPGIKYDCIQVGTSSQRKQGWNAGPSDWAACHAVIHPNGKVQLIFITDGDYCLEI